MLRNAPSAQVKAAAAHIQRLNQNQGKKKPSKAIMAAFYLIGYCAGNIIGLQTFRPKDAIRYVLAEITMMTFYAFCVVGLIFTWSWYQRENRRKSEIRGSVGYVPAENRE